MIYYYHNKKREKLSKSGGIYMIKIDEIDLSEILNYYLQDNILEDRIFEFRIKTLKKILKNV